ncbi:hypothetical protein WAI453_010315 [Rhynchosporium graminicola]
MSITDYGGQGSVFLISSNGETNRLPIPSGSPNDPLGWSPLKFFWHKSATCAIGNRGLARGNCTFSTRRAFIFAFPVLGYWCFDMGTSFNGCWSATSLHNLYSASHNLDIDGCIIARFPYPPQSQMSPRNCGSHFSELDDPHDT